MRASRPAVWHRSAEEEGMAASEPQDGILPEPPESALFLVLNVRDRARDGRAVARVLARVPELTYKLSRSDPRARLHSVVSFGEGLWDAVSPERRPRAFRPFPRRRRARAGRPPRGPGVLEEVLHGFRYSTCATSPASSTAPRTPRAASGPRRR